jgi:dienelactone hydrolase
MGGGGHGAVVSQTVPRDAMRDMPDGAVPRSIAGVPPAPHTRLAQPRGFPLKGCPMKNLPAILLAWFAAALPVSAGDAQVGPWNLSELRQAPAMRWADQTGPVHSLFYTGEKYKGRTTEVFAFYASPATLGKAEAGKKFPGIVLIHGGGGTAFAEWAWLWARRGYAAIAMDLGGSRPIPPVYDPKTGIPVLNQTAKRETRTRLANGGPDQGHAEKFDSIGGDTSEQWPFHAAAEVIRAHSLLRSFPEVDAERTAVTGISWGGYTTCLVASLDDRFKAAVPVYGCGFLHEGESVQKPAIDKLGDLAKRWVEKYDPSSLLPRCHVPILFVNGTNDVHYVLDSYQKSFDCVPGEKQMRIQVAMHHSHPDGWAPKEIGIFIDSHCTGGKPLPIPGKPIIEGENVRLTFSAVTALKSATLHYTVDDGLRSKRTWRDIPAVIAGGVITVPRPPAGANTWFVSVTDERDAMVTTDVQFTKP